MSKYTRDQISNLINSNDRAVERGILAIYKRQTDMEKAAHSTQHNNGVGFSAAHARKGTYMAKWILNGNSLNGKWLISARKMCLHYLGQLTEIANSNYNDSNKE